MFKTIDSHEHNSCETHFKRIWKDEMVLKILLDTDLHASPWNERVYNLYKTFPNPLVCYDMANGVIPE